jgi:hypothetical protein
MKTKFHVTLFDHSKVMRDAGMSIEVFRELL